MICAEEFAVQNAWQQKQHRGPAARLSSDLYHFLKLDYLRKQQVWRCKSVTAANGLSNQFVHVHGQQHRACLIDCFHPFEPAGSAFCYYPSSSNLPGPPYQKKGEQLGPRQCVACTSLLMMHLGVWLFWGLDVTQLLSSGRRPFINSQLCQHMPQHS
jgi:hypothetical protein